MDIISEYILESLTERIVTVYVNNYVMVDGQKTKLGETRSFCFNNSPHDRDALRNVVPDNYYRAVIDVWGASPKVEDPVTGAAEE